MPVLTADTLPHIGDRVAYVGSLTEFHSVVTVTGIYPHPVDGSPRVVVDLDPDVWTPTVNFLANVRPESLRSFDRG